MKKLLFLAGLVMAAVLIACGNANANSSSPAETSGGGSTTTVKIDGKSVEVDTFTAKHYTNDAIAEALVREKFTSKLPKISSASGFGKKKAEVVWRAFAPHGFSIDFVEYGRATVVHYEKGIEIIRDGNSWFYGNIPYDGPSSIFHITAVESVLHPGVWEPAYADLSFGGSDLELHFLYKGACKEDHWILFYDFQQKKYGINSNSDMQISTKEY